MTQINFDQYLTISGGVRLYNCTPHNITFLHEGKEVTLPPCGATLPATPSEVGFSDPVNVFVGTDILAVSTEFVGCQQGYDEIDELSQYGPVMLVGSIISAQAYPASQGNPVVGMVIADPRFSRYPPNERVYSSVKFNAF